MLYVVDTIGVKFSDEFNPTRQELEAEFARRKAEMLHQKQEQVSQLLAQDFESMQPQAQAQQWLVTQKLVIQFMYRVILLLVMQQALMA